MLINRVVVSGFRGAREDLELDLSAPITLLYAPNGVGKTTVCDAVEWAFTGTVKRLSGGSVANWFRVVSGDHLLVDVTGTLGEASVRMGRITSGDLRFRVDGKWRKEDESAWLRRVAGAELSGTSPQARRAFGQAFVRAARFLDSDDLAQLLDDDGRDARASAFAGLLGLERYAKQCADLSRILQELTPGFVDGGLRDLEQSVIQRRAALASSAAQNYAARRVELVERLAGAERALGLPEVDGGLTRGRSDRVAVVIANRLRAITAQSEELDWVRRYWGEQPAWTSRLDEVVQELLTTAEGERDLDRKIREQADRESALRRDVERDTAAVGSLLARDRELEGAQLACEAFIAEWGQRGQPVLPDAKQVDRDVAAARVRVQRAQERHRAWQACWERLDSWEDARRQASGVDEVLVRVQDERSAYAPLAEIDAAIAVTAGALRDAKTHLAALAGPLAQFRSEAVQLLTRMASESHCPLCGHDHVTSDALHRAIRAAAAAEPRAVADASRDIETRMAELARFEDSRRARAGLDEHVALLEAQRGQSGERLREARAFLADAGRPDLDPERDDLRRAVDACRVIANEELQASLFHETACASSAEFAVRAHSVVSAALRALGALGSSASSVGTASPDMWVKAVRDAREELSSTVTRLEHGLSVLRAELAAVAGIRASLASDRYGIEGLRARLEEERHRIQSQWDRFDASAQRIGVVRERLESLETAAHRIAAERNLVRDWDQALHGIGQEIDEVRALSEAAEQVSALDRKLVHARAAAAERHEWKREIEDAIRNLQDHQARRIQAQTEPLRKIVAAMYARSQAHEVVEDIGIRTADSGGWDWVAYVGGKPRGELHHLSRGQRQDLAIAIFLSRSISLGGSVFLDEPFLHLDDLNRAGALDVLRVIALEHGERLRIVLTTANRMLVRHMREKFSLIAGPNRQPLLRIVTLDGSPSSSLTVDVENVVRSALHDEVALIPVSPGEAGLVH